MAYIDDRFPEDGPFLVFIIMHNEKTKKPQFYAKINYEDEDSLCLPLKFWLKSGTLDLRHNLPEIYVNHVLRTIDGKILNKTPTNVQMTNDTNCNSSLSLKIPVRWNSKEVAEKKTKAVKYGACIHKALFKINDPQMLVDWVEIHKALGVEKMLVYLENVPESIPQAAQRYVDEGSLQIFDWHLGKVTRDYGQSGVMTECNYHFMYQVELLGTYDLDEVVVSQHSKTWDQMFDQFSREYSDYKNISSFTFGGLRWHTNVHETGSVCTNARLPLYFKKTLRERRAWDHPKVVVRPLKTLLPQVHSSIGMKGTKGKKVSHKLATCHHYRRELGTEKTDAYYSNLMNKYIKEVLPGVKKTMCSGRDD